MLKLYNRKLLQRLIYEEGPVSKPDLAQMSHLSLPTVNKTVDELVEEGVILEDRMLVASGAGRRAMSFVYNRNSGSVVVMNYSEQKWQGLIVDLFGAVITKMDFPHEDRGVGSLSIVKDHIDLLMQRNDRVRAIGIGIPGVVLKNGVIIGIPSLADLEGVNLRQVLQEKYDVPIVVENDVKLMTVGYHTKYLPDLENLVFLYIAKGLGSGLILNGHLYKGSNSFAGEFGYMSACEESDTEAQHYLDGGSLERYLAFIKDKILTGGVEERSRLIRMISQVIVNFATVVNPEAFILYCDYLYEEELEQVIKQVQRYLPPDSVPRIKLIRDSECGTEGLIRLCLAGIRPWAKMINTY